MTELHKTINELRLSIATEKLEQSKILGDVENQFYEAVGISKPESTYDKFYMTIEKIDKLGADHEEKFQAIGQRIIAIDELLQ